MLLVANGCIEMAVPACSLSGACVFVRCYRNSVLGLPRLCYAFAVQRFVGEFLVARRVIVIWFLVMKSPFLGGMFLARLCMSAIVHRAEICLTIE